MSTVLGRLKVSLAKNGRSNSEIEGTFQVQHDFSRPESRGFVSTEHSNAGELLTSTAVDNYLNVGCSTKKNLNRKEANTAAKSKPNTHKRSSGQNTCRGCPSICICQGGNTFCNGHHIGYQEIEWEDLVNLTYITEGAMCRVYSAEYKGEKVAVKVPREDCEDPETAEHDLEVELEVLWGLNHKHIVKLIGAGIRATALPRFLVMEYLERGTLADRLSLDVTYGQETSGHKMLIAGTPKHKQFHLVTMLERAVELSEALEYLHHSVCQGAIFVIHRDLKPDNVGFKADGTLKLFDFGLARCIKRRARVNARYDMTGETGSMRYMAPEVVGSLPYNEKVDVYAFGLLVWEMLHYSRVFEGMTVGEFNENVVNGGVRPPMDLTWSPALKELLSLCWHADVYKRPDFQMIVSSLRSIYRQEKLRKQQNISFDTTDFESYEDLADQISDTVPPQCYLQCIPRTASASYIIGKSPLRSTTNDDLKYDTDVIKTHKGFMRRLGMRLRNIRKGSNFKENAAATLKHQAPEATMVDRICYSE